MNRFRQLLNDRAPQFVASLVQLISSKTKLAKCDPNTVFAAAITAAALDLPIDPNLGFAHIVPYGDQAQFQLGYKGFIQLAIRTGQYKFLNCCIVHEGELEGLNELTGEVVFNLKSRTSDNVIGYAAYFKLMNGYEHAEYWSCAEVEAHAKRYSQAYQKGYETPWKTDFDAMALKTVIKSLLSHWGIMSVEMQRALTSDQAVRKSVDAEEVIYPDNETHKTEVEVSPEEVKASLKLAEKAS
jgi:recombination protein RecT